MFASFLNTEDGTSTWNHSLKETRTCWFYILNVCWILALQRIKVPDIEYLNTKILEESYQSFCCKSNTIWNLQITFHKSTKYSVICYEMNFHFNCWCWIAVKKYNDICHFLSFSTEKFCRYQKCTSKEMPWLLMNWWQKNFTVTIHDIDWVFLEYSSLNTIKLNTLRLRQNEQHFADDIFKRIFFNENVWI